jgi:hypothetical protein
LNRAQLSAVADRMAAAIARLDRALDAHDLTEARAARADLNRARIAVDVAAVAAPDADRIRSAVVATRTSQARATEALARIVDAYDAEDTFAAADLLELVERLQEAEDHAARAHEAAGAAPRRAVEVVRVVA